MIRQALDTLPNCLPSSKTPTLVLITLSAVVISPRFLPAATAALRTYEDFITIVRFSLSTYRLGQYTVVSLGFESVTKGDGFQFDPDRVLDRDHRTRLENKR